MNSNAKTLITLATYNEIENLPTLVNELRATIPSADILVVDDNSPDGTGQWIKEQSLLDKRLRFVIRTQERGLGTAVITAFKYAISNDYAYVVNLDADGSHPVEAIPRMLDIMTAPSGQYAPPQPDVIIGSRYVRGGGTKNWPTKRKFMSRGINLFTKILLNLKTHDNSGSFRCYRIEKLKLINFDQFYSTGYSFFEEMLFRLNEVNARFLEIPIIFTERTKGYSKIDAGEAFKALIIITKMGLLRLYKRS